LDSDLSAPVNPVGNYLLRRRQLLNLADDYNYRPKMTSQDKRIPDPIGSYLLRRRRVDPVGSYLLKKWSG